jgi:hypothetical protein
MLAALEAVLELAAARAADLPHPVDADMLSKAAVEILTSPEILDRDMKAQLALAAKPFVEDWLARRI